MYCSLWRFLWRSVSAVEEIPAGTQKNSRQNLLSLGSTFSVSTKDYTAAAAPQKCLFHRKEKVTNEKRMSWFQNVNITKEKPLIQLLFTRDVHISYWVISLEEYSKSTDSKLVVITQNWRQWKLLSIKSKPKLVIEPSLIYTCDFCEHQTPYGLFSSTTLTGASDSKNIYRDRAQTLVGQRCSKDSTFVPVCLGRAQAGSERAKPPVHPRGSFELPICCRTLLMGRIMFLWQSEIQK